jgi:hypothetical protein
MTDLVDRILATFAIATAPSGSATSTGDDDE